MGKYLKDKSVPDLLNGEGDILAIYKEEETGSTRLMLHLTDNKGRVFTKYSKEKLIAYLEGRVLIREVIDSSGIDYLIYEGQDRNYFKVPKTVFDFNLIRFMDAPYCQIHESFKPTSIQELINKIEVL